MILVWVQKPVSPQEVDYKGKILLQILLATKIRLYTCAKIATRQLRRKLLKKDLYMHLLSVENVPKNGRKEKR
ncbi:unnamed protein product [Leptidea sinapis]|uniref:Uncharacterized protein n=1 Tax=Leptidea sinapis TaxID=189913 RepID=A0A5E4QFT4_9NEOP|nr:unnamed protein product [Leptidea sinapis]